MLHPVGLFRCSILPPLGEVISVWCKLGTKPSLYWSYLQEKKPHFFFLFGLACVPRPAAQLHSYLLIDGFLQVHQLLEPAEFHLQLRSMQGTGI